MPCHSIIIDDLINFKTVPASEVPGPAMAELSADVAAVCQRYEDVEARVRMEKVADYSPTQVVAGYQLDANVLRTPDAKYSEASSSALRAAAALWKASSENSRIYFCCTG